MQTSPTKCRIVVQAMPDHAKQQLILHYALVPFSTGAGMGIGPPGELSCLAVRISTPVSVTRRVCSGLYGQSIEFQEREEWVKAMDPLGSRHML